MYMTSLEVIWRYLHDKLDGVNEYFFVTDPYSYTSRFIDMISRNPEVIPELKTRMDIERTNSSIVCLLLREGYGMAEYRIIRMMRVSQFREILEREFSWLLKKEEGPRLGRRPKCN